MLMEGVIILLNEVHILKLISYFANSRVNILLSHKVTKRNTRTLLPQKVRTKTSTVSTCSQTHHQEGKQYISFIFEAGRQKIFNIQSGIKWVTELRKNAKINAKK